MDLIVKDEKPQYAPHPEGQFAVQCVDIIDLGQKVKEWQGKSKVVGVLAFVFQSGEVNDLGNAFNLIVEQTKGLSEKANLRKFLGAWRGKPYTDAEVREGVNIGDFLQKPALVSVAHKTTKAGRLFADIASISPLPKMMPAPELPAYTRPDFLNLRKAEYAAKVAAFEGDGEDQHDDLPF